MKCLFLLFILLLSGCVSSQITRFHDNQLLENNNKTFTILPFEDQKQNLEYKQYGNVIAGKLEQRGFKFVSKKSDADYGVRFDYGVDNKKERIANLSDPYYERRYSYSPNITRRTTNYYRGGQSVLGALFMPTPSYYQTYTRFFAINIIDLKHSDLKNPIKLFEGEVKSVGSCNSFSQVGNCLIDALFDNFPGKNGETKNIVASCSTGFCN
jgi:hypothetical protein